MRLSLCLMIATLLTASRGSLLAQDEFDIRWNAPEGNWTVDENWVDDSGQTAFPPVASFEEGAYIGNGGTAIVDSAVQDIFNFSIPSGAVDIRQGGALNVVGTGQFARDVSIGDSGRLILSGDGSLRTSLGLRSSGLIHLGGAGTTLQVGGDLDASAGTLQLDITAAGTPKITGGGNARLGGTIVANFDAGLTPAFGDAFEFLAGANSVVDAGTRVVLPDGVSLAPGLDVQVVAPNNSSAELLVSNLPVLTLNRATGAASIANVVGGPLTMTAYDIRSERGLLNPDGWTSLNSQGDAEWTETNPRTDLIAELNLTGGATLNVGDSVSLGAAYNGGPTHPLDEDAVFKFATPDGRVLDGIVQYEGPANDLVLRVDPDSGEAAIQNLSTFIDPIEVNGYNILSPGGALSVEGWNSFAASGLAGEGWDEANPQANSLAELNLGGSQVFDTNTSILLGGIFTPGNALDLDFQFSTPAGEFRVGTVEYGPLSPPSNDNDLNGDGVVDILDAALVPIGAQDQLTSVLAAAGLTAGDFDGVGGVAFPDFLTLSNNFGQSTMSYVQGDVDVNGIVNFPDFLTLSTNFGTGAAATASVPEPGGAMTVMAVAFGLLTASRYRGRKGMTHQPTAPRRELGTKWMRATRSATSVIVASVVATAFMTVGLNRTRAEVISIRIADANDDAEESVQDSSMYLDSSDLEIGADGGGVDAQLIGLRFLEVDIPRNATINSAHIQFTVDETDDEVQSSPIEIFGELGDALAFSTAVGDISNRGRTGATVAWSDIPPWPTVGEAGPDQQTPNIGPVIQAIVNQSTWEPNNPLVIMFGGQADFERTAESFEGDAAAAALLTIDFDPTSSFLVGDFNADGAVDLADYSILLSNFSTGTTFAEGDATLDGVVDLRDFIEFKQAFDSAGGVAAAVPEPGAIWLIGVGMALVACGRRTSRLGA